MDSFFNDLSQAQATLIGAVLGAVVVAIGWWVTRPKRWGDWEAVKTDLEICQLLDDRDAELRELLKTYARVRLRRYATEETQARVNWARVVALSPVAWAGILSGVYIVSLGSGSGDWNVAIWFGGGYLAILGASLQIGVFRRFYPGGGHAKSDDEISRLHLEFERHESRNRRTSA
ncbi:membrane protein [Gordonia phage LordFarquaad]|uniref:Membrane protein n=1 Tax=Gordonia phage LordFarquaad TaxID=2588134 RepID=A0A4Y6ET05_9CAUD|nr:membrane protein [Gordonia phage LordFarquaad]